MKPIITIIILLSISILEVRAQEYSTDTLNDSVQVIIPAYDGSNTVHIEFEIFRTDNSKFVNGGFDSLYTIKYVFTIRDKEGDYIEKRLQSLRGIVKKSASVDKFRQTKAIIDSTLTDYKTLTFLYLPIIHRDGIFDMYPIADGARESECSLTKITIEKDTDNITMLISVKDIISITSGGFANGRWQDTIPISECVKLDREKKSRFISYINNYPTRTAVKFWNFLNGSSLGLFKRGEYLTLKTKNHD